MTHVLMFKPHPDPQIRDLESRRVRAAEDAHVGAPLDDLTLLYEVDEVAPFIDRLRRIAAEQEIAIKDVGWSHGGGLAIRFATRDDMVAFCALFGERPARMIEEAAA